MSTTFDIRRWATQAGIQTTGGFAVIAECVTMDELQRFAEIAIASAGGVQALSAAPAGFVPVAAFDRLHAHAESLAARLLAAEQAAPKAAPGEQNTVPAEWLEQAYREGWAACRDAETIGEEAEDWAFGNSTTNSRMIDAQQAAPQPVPVNAWQQAIDHELVTAHIGVAGAATLEEARKALHELICWHIDVATDPATNGGKVLVDAALAAQGGKA